jgi:hypothetical protein
VDRLDGISVGFGDSEEGNFGVASRGNDTSGWVRSEVGSVTYNFGVEMVDLPVLGGIYNLAFVGFDKFRAGKSLRYRSVLDVAELEYAIRGLDTLEGGLEKVTEDFWSSHFDY